MISFEIPWTAMLNYNHYYGLCTTVARPDILKSVDLGKIEWTNGYQWQRAKEPTQYFSTTSPFS